MQSQPVHSPKFPNIRRLWKPVVGTAAGSSAIAFWFDEILIFGEEILVLIFFAIVGGLMALFNLLIFKSKTPRREDFDNTNTKGVKK
jgi:hypothetical protein